MHTIRLRDPWQASWLEDDEREETCAARYERKFHRPTGIEGAGVFLSIAFVALDPNHFSATLNDVLLGMHASQSGQWSISVAEQLQAFNRLVVVMRVPRNNADSAIPSLNSIAEICLQIEDSP